MKYIAVLITVHNRKAKTLECLSNLFSQQVTNGYQFEVYLTDDGCDDGTPEAVTKLFPEVKIIDGDGTLYWNRGMHKAWLAASKAKEYDYYLWLNDDTILYPNALDALLEASKEKEQKAIIVGTTCAVRSEDKITYGGRSKKGSLIVPSEVLEECNYFNGNIVLLPKHVYKKVGINDPIFHHALGDFDYGLRAAKKGVKFYIVPGILGRCDEHKQLAIWCNPKHPFSKRWRAFRTPLGHNPEEFFIFEKRHNGLATAIFHYVTNHLRVFMPKLWKSTI